jgi:hypothetical protein
LNGNSSSMTKLEAPPSPVAKAKRKVHMMSILWGIDLCRL